VEDLSTPFFDKIVSSVKPLETISAIITLYLRKQKANAPALQEQPGAWPREVRLPRQGYCSLTSCRSQAGG